MNYVQYTVKKGMRGGECNYLKGIMYCVQLKRGEGVGKVIMYSVQLREKFKTMYSWGSNYVQCTDIV